MTKKYKPSQWKNGVRKIGPQRYELRLTAQRDKKTRKKPLDTKRVVTADSALEAANIRGELQKELAAQAGVIAGEWTVSDAFRHYLPTLRAGTLHSWGSHARKIEQVFGTRRLSSIKPDEIQRFIVSLPVADVTANNVRTLLGRLYAYAFGQGKYVGRNPVKDTVNRRRAMTGAEKLAAIESKPRRSLAISEIRRYLEAFPSDLRPLITIQLLLGCRFAEITALKWSDVNWETGWVRIVRGQYKGEIGPTKADRMRWTALAPEGLALMAAHRRDMEERRWPGWEEWVFPRPVYWDGAPRPTDFWNYETVRAWVMRIQREQGLKVASRTHAMRHTFVTHARPERKDDLLREAVGHASIAQTDDYTDQSMPPAPKELVDFQSQMHAKLVGLLEAEIDGSSPSDEK